MNLSSGFVAVRCPQDRTVLFEAGPDLAGSARHKCPECRKVWVVEGAYPDFEAWMVDTPRPRLLESA